MSNAIAEIRKELGAMAPQFKAALPAHIPAEKFMRVTMTAIQMNNDLIGANRQSFFSAAMKAAQDGLLPDGREGAMVIYGSDVQWQPMVGGIMKKVRNSKEIRGWSVHVVHENDEFDYQLGDEEKIVHKPAKKDRGAIIGAYSIVSLKGGEKSREYMPIGEIHGIRDRSKGYNYAKKNNKQNPWITDEGEMCKKTVVRRHAKRLPMSTDLDDIIRASDDTDFTIVPKKDDIVQSKELTEVLGMISESGDIETLEAVKPRINAMKGQERQAALESYASRQGVLKSGASDEDKDPV